MNFEVLGNDKALAMGRFKIAKNCPISYKEV